MDGAPSIARHELIHRTAGLRPAATADGTRSTCEPAPACSRRLLRVTDPRSESPTPPWMKKADSTTEHTDYAEGRHVEGPLPHKTHSKASSAFKFRVFRVFRSSQRIRKNRYRFASVSYDSSKAIQSQSGFVAVFCFDSSSIRRTTSYERASRTRATPRSAAIPAAGPRGIPPRDSESKQPHGWQSRPTYEERRFNYGILGIHGRKTGS